MHGVEDSCIQGFSEKTWGKEDYLENPGIDIGWGCIDWIDLAQDRNKWQARVNTVVNLQVP
jgi:hypothetical protein